MFNKILIANRGEIALRIIRACRELDIKTVAVFSKADELSLHTKFADEAICIGPNESSKSYLNIPSILAAVELTDADAIHPGYGFLSESSKFSAICKDNNIAFIGSDSDTINLMGNKSLAKDTMKNVGVPIIPGSDGNVNSFDEAKFLCTDIGYPVIIKAVSGGGGKGMRLVNDESELQNAYEMAKIEAEAAFSDGNVYIEKFLINPRHIEIQVICDSFGNVIPLGERECSLQRRHQKILEESPSCIMNQSLRDKLYESSTKACKAVNYVGAGTIEYLVDNEMNYDSMIAKIIVHAPNRKEAIDRMRGALDECVVEGIQTTIPFLKEILSNPKFIEGDIHTGFIDKLME